MVSPKSLNYVLEILGGVHVEAIGYPQKNLKAVNQN
jgi:hypothetical protein